VEELKTCNKGEGGVSSSDWLLVERTADPLPYASMASPDRSLWSGLDIIRQTGVILPPA